MEPENSSPQPIPSGPSRVAIAFRLIGGLLLGAGLGMLFVFGLVTILGEIDRSGEPWYLLGIFYFGIPIMTCIGAVVGLGIAIWKRHSRWMVWLSGAGYVLAAGVLVVYSWSQLQKRERLSDRQDAISEAWADWERTFGAKYPHEEASLPSLLGPLLYPNSRLVHWKQSHMYTEHTPRVWDIAVSTDDSLEQVLAYYMSVLPEGLKYEPGSSSIDRPWCFYSEPQSSADGRETRVVIERNGEGFWIGFGTGEGMHSYPRWKTAEEIPDAWPEDRQTYLQRVEELQRPLREDFEQTFDGLFYPNARLLCAEFREGYRPGAIYVTDDPPSEVGAFFRSQISESGVAQNASQFYLQREDGIRLTFQLYPPKMNPGLDGVLFEYGSYKNPYWN